MCGEVDLTGEGLRNILDVTMIDLQKEPHSEEVQLLQDHQPFIAYRKSQGWNPEPELDYMTDQFGLKKVDDIGCLD